MKREILFRGKMINGGKWIYGSLLTEYEGTCMISFWTSQLIEPESNYSEMVNDCIEVIPEIVGQFTGLTDKNGVKIFEGDITKSVHVKMISSGITDCPTDPIEIPEFENREYYNQIDWFQGVKISGWRIKGKGFQAQLKWSTVLNMGLEVIGNIHDNPELLK